MTTIRPFQATDLLKFNTVNIDPWTETYNLKFYCSYLSTWPDFSSTALHPSSGIIGYSIGKHEPPAPHPEHHGHISALSVAPCARGVGVARKLNSFLEQRTGEDAADAWFLDLFVRCTNGRAVGMYEGMGYRVFRRVVGYYQGIDGDSPDEQDGFDMRKPMPKDSDRRCLRGGGRENRVSPREVWS